MCRQQTLAGVFDALFQRPDASRCRHGDGFALGPSGPIARRRWPDRRQDTVYTWRAGTLKKLAKLDAVLVASLAVGQSGTVFAGTMPGGRVFAIDKDGKVREAAKLDAEHVWALSYDEQKQTRHDLSNTKRLWRSLPHFFLLSATIAHKPWSNKVISRQTSGFTQINKRKKPR